MLTGDVSETGGFRLFRSRDFGLTFDPVDLPFEPLIQMLYNPGDCNIILTLSVMVTPEMIYCSFQNLPNVGTTSLLS